MFRLSQLNLNYENKQLRNFVMDFIFQEVM